jgi:hypothetical protein
MELILAAITIIGFFLTIVVLIFTEQGSELLENMQYYLKRNKASLKNTYKSDSNEITKNQAKSLNKESRFVRDLTIFDGSKIKVDQKFKKIWEIENIGEQPWENRFLERVGPCEGPGRLKSKKRVKIPYTLPGQRSQIKLNLVAPDQPGSCYAEWKMVDEKGNILLPHQKPLFVSIDVIE